MELEKNANKYLAELLEDGKRIICDETSETFQKNELPSFYNKELFERGKKFYYENISALTLTKLLGLITTISTPSIFKILQSTNNTNSTKGAYKRYLETVMHVHIWYDNDFEPNSRAWKSLIEVKNRHNSVSKNAQITQLDMVITQFGMFGLALVNPGYLGLSHATTEDWEGLIHVWRVLGHVLGIEDRFNICRPTVDETKTLCTKLLRDVIRWNFIASRQEKGFRQMAQDIINGVWSLSPYLQYHVVIAYLFKLVTSDEITVSLNFWGKFYYYFTHLMLMYLFSFAWYRTLANWQTQLLMWLAVHFPILTYFQFGLKDVTNKAGKILKGQ